MSTAATARVSDRVNSATDWSGARGSTRASTWAACSPVSSASETCSTIRATCRALICPPASSAAVPGSMNRRARASAIRCTVPMMDSLNASRTASETTRSVSTCTSEIGTGPTKPASATAPRAATQAAARSHACTRYSRSSADQPATTPGSSPSKTAMVSTPGAASASDRATEPAGTSTPVLTADHLRP